jgi:translation elongation factor EF-G
VEPLDEEDLDEKDRAAGKKVLFVDQTVGGSIPPSFIPACEKGFMEAVVEGPVIGHQLEGVRFVINDGSWHSVDSNELAFRIATINAFRQGIQVPSYDSLTSRNRRAQGQPRRSGAHHDS